MRVIWLYTWHLQKAHRFTWALLILFFLILAFVVQWADSVVPPPLDVAACLARSAQNSLLFIVLGIFVFLFAAGGVMRDALTSGVLEQFSLQGYPTFLSLGAAIFVQWGAIGVPLALLIAGHNSLMHDAAISTGVLLPVALLVFFNASVWGAALGGLFTHAAQNGAYLLALLLLPLTLPSLLFGGGALMTAPLESQPYLWGPLGLTPFGEALGFLLALSAVTFPMGAFLGGAICRQQMEI